MGKLRRNQPGVCPECGSEHLNYGEEKKDGESLTIAWECECGFVGKEVYNLVFVGHTEVTEQIDMKGGIQND